MDIVAQMSLAPCHQKLTCLVDGLEVKHITNNDIMEEARLA